MTRKPLTVVDVTKLGTKELLALRDRGFDVQSEIDLRYIPIEVINRYYRDQAIAAGFHAQG